MPFIIVLLLIIFGIYYAWPKPATHESSENNILVNDVILADNILFFRKLDPQQKKQFENEVKEFLTTIKITGVNTIITDLDKILVAASAVIPIFSFPDWKYQNLHEVLLYSDVINMEFQTEGAERNILGMVGTGYMEGKMLLSKPALELGFKNSTDKNNTAIHEFVHLLDKADGDTDGIPALLLDKQYVLPWLEMIRQETIKIKENRSDINPYAYTNKSEFFAVTAEYFFERPDLLQRKHPELYTLLSQVFKVTL